VVIKFGAGASRTGADERAASFLFSLTFSPLFGYLFGGHLSPFFLLGRVEDKKGFLLKDGGVPSCPPPCSDICRHDGRVLAVP